MALNISLPSTAITELESYRWYDAAGASLKDVITSVYFSAASAVDVSDWVTGINISGSINNYSGEPGANRAQVQLNNFDKRFSDLNTAGPYYGFLSPGKSVKIELNVAGTLVPIFTGKISPQGFIETREGTQGTAMFEILDGADALERKKFDKDYYYTAKNLVDVTSTANSLLHILLETHGSLASSNIVCNGSVSILVDYTVFKEGESVMQRLREIATGSLAQYCGFRYDGKFVMESRLKAGWSVPASEYTLNADALNVSVSKTLSPLLGNHVKVRGDKTAYLSNGVVLWELRKVKPIGVNAVYPGWCWEAVNNGDTYLSGPSTASTQSEYWAEYMIDGADILHVDSAAMTMKVWEGTAYNLTTTGTDLAAESKRAKLVLQNLSGSTVHVMNIQITGKAAIRYSIGKKSESDIQQLKIDQGISDDDLNWGRIGVDSNASSIAAYGQTDLVVSSEYIVDDTQLVSILDWNLKYGKDPKHHFAIEQLPFLAFVQPGADLTLKLNELGYSALTEVAQFSHNITPDGAQTMLELVETPTSWSQSSVSSVIPVQTIISAPSGGTGQGEVRAAGTGGNLMITVGAAGTTLSCDKICDGANDQVEINEAINEIGQTGTVVLIGGTFNISAAISIASNVRLEIDSSAILMSRMTSAILTAVGTAATHLSNIRICGTGKIKTGNSLSSLIDYTNFRYIDGFAIDDITIEDGAALGIYLAYGTNAVIRNCKFLRTQCAIRADYSMINIINNYIDGQNAPQYSQVIAGIAVNNDIQSFIVDGNTIVNFSIASCVTGWEIQTGAIKAGSNSMSNVRGNIIRKMNNRGTWQFRGINMKASYSICSGNIIEDVDNVSMPSATHGIYVEGDYDTVDGNNVNSCSGFGIFIASSASSTLVTGNICRANGSDSGIANDNGNNYKDWGTDTQVG